MSGMRRSYQTSNALQFSTIGNTPRTGLTGVRGLTNKVTIKARVAQPAEIKNKIEQALKRAAEREAEHLNIEVRGSRVLLSGKVRSFAELRDVRGAAWS